MKEPPPGIRIQVFRPLRQLPVGSFTIQPQKIAAALLLGHDEALHQMETVETKSIPLTVAPPTTGQST
jgi:hypothetical protein